MTTKKRSFTVHLPVIYDEVYSIIATTPYAAKEKALALIGKDSCPEFCAAESEGSLANRADIRVIRDSDDKEYYYDTPE